MIRNRRTENEGQGGVDGDQDPTTRSPAVTLMITFGTPTAGDVSINGALTPTDISVIRTIDIPIFVADGTEELGISSSFFAYIQELIDSIKRRDYMKKELLRNRPMIYTKEMEPNECMVCMTEFKPKQFVRKLACEHEFHRKCIDKWLLQGNGRCPLCRKEPFKKKGK